VDPIKSGGRFRACNKFAIGNLMTKLMQAIRLASLKSIKPTHIRCAIDVSLLIIRALIGLRQLLARNTDLMRKVQDLDRRLAKQNRKIEAINHRMKESDLKPRKTKNRPRKRTQSQAKVNHRKRKH
jgi:hypothetical protein